ncbi:MAG: lysophospholipid acyltransferase family protein [Bacteroidia bacterium]|nr:lysophospholipid acyltransferase family protein [Bacteroidia bacterium]
MKGLRNIIQGIYSFYALALFFITIIPAVVVYLFFLPMPVNRRMRAIYVYNKIWLGTWARLCGITLITKGAEYLDPRQTYVFILNHCNMLDIIMAGSMIQHSFKPLIKKELLRVPFLGQLLAMAAIPVDRSSTRSRKESFDRMMAALKEETSILIFPEGTRNRTSEPLKNFYDGGFRLAIAAQLPILPIALLNSRHLQPVGTYFLQPGRVVLEFMEPVPTTGMTKEDVDTLKDQVFERMKAHILTHDVYFQQPESVRS